MEHKGLTILTRACWTEVASVIPIPRCLLETVPNLQALRIQRKISEESREGASEQSASRITFTALGSSGPGSTSQQSQSLPGGRQPIGRFPPTLIGAAAPSAAGYGIGMQRQMSRQGEGLLSSGGGAGVLPNLLAKPHQRALPVAVDEEFDAGHGRRQLLSLGGLPSMPTVGQRTVRSCERWLRMMIVLCGVIGKSTSIDIE